MECVENTINKFLKILGLPLVVLAVFLSLRAVWKIFDLPQEDELVEMTRRYFDLYGYGIVFVSAMIEGMLLAGWYYPGSLVIFLGVIFAGRNIPEVIAVVALVTIGLFVADLFDYALGKYGWYRLLLRFGLLGPMESAQLRLAKYGPSGIFLSYWHPNLAALTATAAGTLQFPFKKFALYSAIALGLWNAFWGALVYFLGEAALTLIGTRFVLVVLAAWILYRLIFKKKYSIPEAPGTEQPPGYI